MVVRIRKIPASSLFSTARMLREEKQGEIVQTAPSADDIIM